MTNNRSVERMPAAMVLESLQELSAPADARMQLRAALWAQEEAKLLVHLRVRVLHLLVGHLLQLANECLRLAARLLRIVGQVHFLDFRLRKDLHAHLIERLPLIDPAAAALTHAHVRAVAHGAIFCMRAERTANPWLRPSSNSTWMRSRPMAPPRSVTVPVPSTRCSTRSPTSILDRPVLANVREAYWPNARVGRIPGAASRRA